MDLRDYVRLVRIRRSLIILCTLLGIALAALGTLLATPVYQASATMFVSTGDTSQTVGSAYTGTLYSQQRVKSYANVITSPLVTTAVIDRLGLDTTPAALSARISASAPSDTVLLRIVVKDVSPRRAAEIANAASEQFITVVDDLERGAGSTQSLVSVSVVTPATAPSEPITPRTNLNLALGLAVGLVVGVGIAVARETLDQSVKGVEELQEEHGLATLGVIAYDSDASRNPLIVQAAPNSTRAEAFRQLRTNLQFVDVDEVPKSIVVTSSLPQEGKSTTTCNLAVTLAEAGVDVILVEGDLRRPRLADYMAIEGAVGLTDVMIGRVTLDDALQPWGTSGHLWVLPGGARPPNPSELLGSRHMAALLKQLEGRGLVLIDAPPLLPVTDAAVMSTMASGAVVVVKAKSTRRDQLDQALDDLRSVGAHVYGAVFNMAPVKGPDSYRYGYGYSYGYAYGETKKSLRVPRPKLDGAPVLKPASDMGGGRGAPQGSAEPVGETASSIRQV